MPGDDMGWNLRRSLRFGPFRINLSKSGVGYSVGLPGYRLGKDAKGRPYQQMSIPGTGIYRRDYMQPGTQQAQPTQPQQSSSSGRLIFYGILLLLLIWIVVKSFS
jgi:hypothetical protein